MQLTRPLKLILAVLALAATIAAFGAVGAGFSATGTANADPGFCGVRSDYYYEAGKVHYVVRNKCGTAHRFAVYLPGLRRGTQTGCRTVGAGARQGYVDDWADANWYIRNC